MIPDSLKNELLIRISSAVTRREAVVDTLKMIQAHYGWLTDEGVEEAALLLGLTTLEIEELATFYEMIYRRPVGKRVVHMCDSISCWAMGGETLLSHIATMLKIQPGETTSDGFFTLLPCCCLGNCGDAPAMMIGDSLYGRLTPELVGEYLEKERMQWQVAVVTEGES